MIVHGVRRCRSIVGVDIVLLDWRLLQSKGVQVRIDASSFLLSSTHLFVLLLHRHVDCQAIADHPRLRPQRH